MMQPLSSGGLQDDPVSRIQGSVKAPSNSENKKAYYEIYIAEIGT